jgi:hypothetical protein
MLEVLVLRERERERERERQREREREREREGKVTQVLSDCVFGLFILFLFFCSPG